MNGQETGTIDAESPTADRDLENDAPISAEGSQRDHPAPPAERTDVETETGADPAQGTSPAADEAPELSERELAINRLARPEPAAPPAPAKPKAQPAVIDGDRPRDEQGRFAPQDQVKPAKLTEDPFATDPELKVLKGKARERFATLHSRARAAETEREAIQAEREQMAQELEKAKPHAKYGEIFSKIVADHNAAEDLKLVTDDQIAGSVKIQAAAVRLVDAATSGRQPTVADLELLEGHWAKAGQLLQAFGRAQTSAAPAEFTGEIPAELKQLADDYGIIDDEEAKLLAAHRATKQAKATATPPKPAPAVAAAAPAPARVAAPAAAPAAAAPTPAARDVIDPRDVEEAHYEAKTIDALERDGIKGPRAQQDYFDREVFPRVLKSLQRAQPKIDPKRAFFALGGRAKHDLVMDAHAELKSARRSPTRTASDESGQPMRQAGHGAPRGRSAGDGDESPTLAAINFMSRD